MAPYAVTSIAWAPSCGRSYHLVATGSRDGHVRIWKLRPGSLDEERMEGSDDTKWSGSVVADFDHHKCVHLLWPTFYNLRVRVCTQVCGRQG